MSELSEYRRLSSYLNQVGQEFNQHSGAKPNAWNGIFRVQEELDEARNEVTPSNCTEKFVVECADVVLTLTSVCAGLGLDLDKAIADKHAINMKQQWEPHPTIPGGVRHIKKDKE